MATKNKNNNGDKKADKGTEYDGIKIMFQVVGEYIGVRIEVDKDKMMDYFVAAKDHLKDCLSEFIEFNKKHPGITEMHFLTKPTEWEC